MLLMTNLRTRWSTPSILQTTSKSIAKLVLPDHPSTKLKNMIGSRHGNRLNKTRLFIIHQKRHQIARSRNVVAIRSTRNSLLNMTIGSEALLSKIELRWKVNWLSFEHGWIDSIALPLQSRRPLLTIGEKRKGHCVKT